MTILTGGEAGLVRDWTNDMGACDLDLEYYKNGIKYFKQKKHAVTFLCSKLTLKGTLSVVVFMFVSFVGLFVFFQMSLQFDYLRGCIFALVAFVWLFSTVCFQMSLQIACIRGCIVALVAFAWFSPLCVFKCLLNSLAREDA